MIDLESGFGFADNFDEDDDGNFDYNQGASDAFAHAERKLQEWLKEHDRQIAEAAWTAGYRQSTGAHGHIPNGSDWSNFSPPESGKNANPHRAEDES